VPGHVILPELILTNTLDYTGLYSTLQDIQSKTLEGKRMNSTKTATLTFCTELELLRAQWHRTPETQALSSNNNKRG